MLPCTHPLCNTLSAFADPEYVPSEPTARGLVELKRALVDANYTTAAVVDASGRTAQRRRRARPSGPPDRPSAP